MPPVDFVSGLGPLNWTYDKTSGTGTLSQGSKTGPCTDRKTMTSMPVKIWYSAGRTVQLS